MIHLWINRFKWDLLESSETNLIIRVYSDFIDFFIQTSFNSYLFRFAFQITGKAQFTEKTITDTFINNNYNNCCSIIF